MKEAKMLTALRSNCVKGIRHNFSKQYKDCMKCPSQCNPLNQQEDTQDHILFCTKLSKGIYPQINQIYGDVPQQTSVTRVFLVLMNKRTKSLQTIEDQQQQPTGGNIPGPSILTATARRNGYTATH